MGLLAEFTMEDLGYADSTEELGVSIDYSYGCEVFAETFLDVARDLAPVDTGRLMGSIEAYADMDGCTCITDCEYAEYVEYGTDYMSPQAYFEPALSAALDAAMPCWDEAVEDAMEEEAQLLEEIAMAEQQAAQAAQRGGGGGGFGANIGVILGFLFAAFIIGMIRGFFNMLDSVGRHYGGGGRGSSSRSADSLKGYVDDIEVEII